MGFSERIDTILKWTEPAELALKKSNVIMIDKNGAFWKGTGLYFYSLLSEMFVCQ